MKKLISFILFMSISINLFAISPKSKIDTSVFNACFDSYENLKYATKDKKFMNKVFMHTGFTYTHIEKSLKAKGDNEYHYKYNDVHSHYDHIWKTIRFVDKFKFLNDWEARTLRIIMFFHDISKFMVNKNHAEISSVIARYILSDMDYDIIYVNFICNMIKMHDKLTFQPNYFYELKGLSEDELQFLFQITAIDIMERKEFDTKNNLYILKRTAKTLLLNSCIEIDFLRDQLYTIWLKLREKDYSKYIPNWNMTHYVLKDIMYMFIDKPELPMIGDSILKAV